MKILYPPFKKTNRTVQHTFYSPYGRTLLHTACSQCVVCSLGGIPSPSPNQQELAGIPRNQQELHGSARNGELWCCGVQV